MHSASLHTCLIIIHTCVTSFPSFRHRWLLPFTQNLHLGLGGGAGAGLGSRPASSSALRGGVAGAGLAVGGPGGESAVTAACGRSGSGGGGGSGVLRFAHDGRLGEAEEQLCRCEGGYEYSG